MCVRGKTSDSAPKQRQRDEVNGRNVWALLTRRENKTPGKRTACVRPTCRRRIEEEKESKAPPPGSLTVFSRRANRPDRLFGPDRHETFVTRSGRWLDGHDSARTSSPPNPFFDCPCQAPGSVGEKESGEEDRRVTRLTTTKRRSYATFFYPFFFLICRDSVWVYFSVSLLGRIPLSPHRTDRGAAIQRDKIEFNQICNFTYVPHRSGGARHLFVMRERGGKET